MSATKFHLGKVNKLSVIFEIYTFLLKEEFLNHTHSLSKLSRLFLQSTHKFTDHRFKQYMTTFFDIKLPEHQS